MYNDFAGKRVLIMGLGRFGGGVGVTRWLCDQGASVTVTDLATEDDLAESLIALDGYDVSYHLGGHREDDLEVCDLLVVNPAVNKHKSEYFRKAKELGIPWTSEMNLFLERCRGQIVGVTGSVGKSTTTAMIGDILQAAANHHDWSYGNVWLGGNIGKSLLEDLPDIAERDVVVLELSSFQLEDAAEIGRSPNVAVVTNIRENHLDRHGTLEAYAAAKATILKYQSSDDWLIVPFDSGVDLLPSGWEDKLRLWRFGVDPETNRVRWERPGEAGRKTETIDVSLSIPGRHNLENAAAALAAARVLGVGDKDSLNVLRDFRGLPHRLELVCERDGIRYYNDSKATTPEAAMTSLRAFDCGVVVLVGGSDKGTSFDALGRALAERAKGVVCMGDTGPTIAAALRASRSGDEPAATTVESFEEGMDAARAMASPGDVILLSPGCASFDWFRNYEERGELFRALAAE